MSTDAIKATKGCSVFKFVEDTLVFQRLWYVQIGFLSLHNYHHYKVLCYMCCRCGCCVLVHGYRVAGPQHPLSQLRRHFLNFLTGKAVLFQILLPKAFRAVIIPSARRMGGHSTVVDLNFQQSMP